MGGGRGIQLVAICNLTARFHYILHTAPTWRIARQSNLLTNHTKTGGEILGKTNFGLYNQSKVSLPGCKIILTVGLADIKCKMTTLDAALVV